MSGGKIKEPKKEWIGVLLCIIFSAFGLLYVPMKTWMIILAVSVTFLFYYLFGESYLLIINIVAAIYAYFAIKKYNASLTSSQTPPNSVQPPQTPPEQNQSS